jgi:hypothetical protein
MARWTLGPQTSGFGNGITVKTRIVGSATLLFGALYTSATANAQSGQNPNFGVGNIHHGLAVGAVAGVAAIVGVGITYLVLHNRGVADGCIAESGGKRTFVGSDKKVYLLIDSGLSLPVGERAKLKGHRSGPASAPSFKVEKVLKDYGRCGP